MKSTKQISSVGAMCIALSLFGVSLDIASAQQAPCRECQALPRSMGARVCVPNTQNWGYFTGTWRVWPEERRPDVTFPRAVGAERVPTPAAGLVPETLPSGVNSGNVPVQSSQTVLPSIDFGDINQGVVTPSGKEAFEPQELLPTLTPAPSVVPAPAPIQETIPVVEPATPVEKPAEVPATKPAGGADLDASLPMIDSESVSSSASQLTPIPVESALPLDSTTPETGALPPLTLPAAPASDTTPAEISLPPLTSVPKEGTQKANDKSGKSLESMKYAFRSRNSGKQESTVNNPPSATPATNPSSANATQNKSQNQNLTKNLQKIDTNVAPTTYVTPATNSINPTKTSSSLPKISEPLALDGFCPVELINNESWKSGQEEWAIIFEGRAYYCSSQQDREKFMADPMRYTPVCKGQDPLFLLQQNRSVEGRTDFCVIYGKKLYLFASASTMKQFRENPKQFARQIAELESKNM